MHKKPQLQRRFSIPYRWILYLLIVVTMLSCLGIPANGIRTAPDFEVVDIRGNLFKLSNATSKVILLDFFATWCAPCIIAIPEFREIYAQYTRNDLEIVSISPEDLTTLRSFADKPDISMTWIVASDQDGSITTSYLGSDTRIPHLFLVDSEGYIRYDHLGWAGESDATELRSRIDSVLSGEANHDNETTEPNLLLPAIIAVVVIISIVGLFIAGQFLGWSKPPKKRRKRRMQETDHCWLTQLDIARKCSWRELYPKQERSQLEIG